MNTFKNKVVVVTGGSDGIGKALVEYFLEQGAMVSTCARNYDKLYQIQQQNVGKPLHIFTCDVSNELECKKYIESIIAAYSTIDILINNAGISMRSLFADAEISTLQKVMNINFWGMVYCTKFSLPYITKNKGSIIGISSIAGYRGLPGRTAYSASKFAMNGFLESLRTELLQTGVNVMWVSPGFTSSNIRNVALNAAGNMQGESPMNENEMMSSNECATHIAKAIEQRKRNLVLTFKGRQTVFMNKFFAQLTDKLTYNFFFKNNELIK